MPASKEDFIAHQQKSEHKNAEHKKTIEMSKARLASMAPSPMTPSMNALSPMIPSLMSLSLSPMISSPMIRTPIAPPMIRTPIGPPTMIRPPTVRTPINPPMPIQRPIETGQTLPSQVRELFSTINNVAPNNGTDRPAIARKYVIRIDQIKWTATKQEIINCLGGVNVIASGVHFILHRTNIARQNDAFIELVNEKDYQQIVNGSVKVPHNSEIGDNIKGNTYTEKLHFPLLIYRFVIRSAGTYFIFGFLQ